MQIHDIPVDLIVAPEEVVETRTAFRRPLGFSGISFQLGRSKPSPFSISFDEGGLFMMSDMEGKVR